MDLLKKLLLAVGLLTILWATPAMAEQITIVTPYWGMEENTYQNDEYGLKLKDTQATKGLYLQSIDTEKYQWNLFLYRTSDINDSDLTGANFIYDYYFAADAKGKNAVGVGVNYLQLDLSGKNLPLIGSPMPLPGFDLDLDVASLYLRAGRYFNYDAGSFQGTVFPWVGGQLDHQTGDGLADYPGPGFAAFKIDDDQYSWIAGLNFKATYHHFLQLDAKHTVTYNHDGYYNKDTAMVNLFFNQRWGLSYRYNYQETSVGNDRYHLFGVAMVF